MINESNGTFENCLFNNCSVVTDVTKNVPRGGSIYMIQSSYKFNISNFTSNFVRSEGSDSYVSGGAIDVLYSDVIIEKCFFIHNSVRSKNHLRYIS